MHESHHSLTAVVDCCGRLERVKAMKKGCVVGAAILFGLAAFSCVRYEEDTYMMRMMKVAGHEKTEIYELQGFNHRQMAQPAHTILLQHIRRHQ